jgi:hypothetical protein
MEAGSNLVVFNTDVHFENPGKEPFYYYTVAKDFEWSFLALQVLVPNPTGGLPLKVKFEKVDRLPLNFVESGQNMTDNLLIFKIHLPSTDSTHFGVNEYHQNRKEPFPKTIKVYEKQTVEVYESKYYLSVYPTKESILIFKVNQKDIHYKSEEPTQSNGQQVEYGPYRDLDPITFEQIQLFFTFPYPLPVFTEAKRDIFVSHWGEISVDEYFNFFNLAAGIDGQFSRIDYMPHINPNQG